MSKENKRGITPLSKNELEWERQSDMIQNYEDRMQSESKSSPTELYEHDE